MLSGKLSENTVRTTLILITTYFVLIFGAILFNVYTNPLGIDDSLKSDLENISRFLPLEGKIEQSDTIK